MLFFNEKLATLKKTPYVPICSQTGAHMTQNKRDDLVRKALKVFYANGFHATGMDKIAADVGISKTSIYKHFRTKEDLILATLRLRDEMIRNQLFRRMEALGATPQDQLLTLFDALEDWFSEPTFQGCMFIKASAEYQGTADPINVQSMEHKRLMQERIAQVCRAAGRDDPETMARHLMLLVEGATVLAGMSHSPAPARDAKAAARALLGM